MCAKTVASELKTTCFGCGKKKLSTRSSWYCYNCGRKLKSAAKKAASRK